MEVRLEKPGARVDIDGASDEAEAVGAALGIEYFDSGDHPEGIIGIRRIGRVVEGGVHAQLGI